MTTFVKLLLVGWAVIAIEQGAGVGDEFVPVRRETRRKGSPYLLVLTKTSELYDLDVRARQRDLADLALVTGCVVFAVVVR